MCSIRKPRKALCAVAGLLLLGGSLHVADAAAPAQAIPRVARVAAVAPALRAALAKLTPVSSTRWTTR